MQQKYKPTSLGKKIKHRIESIDLFGQQANILVDGDKNSKETILGALFSLMLVLSVVYFALIKYSVMMRFGDTVINTKELENYYQGN